jgi:hypothetical protein
VDVWSVGRRWTMGCHQRWSDGQYVVIWAVRRFGWCAIWAVRRSGYDAIWPVCCDLGGAVI